MSEFEKYINKLEVDYVAANPKQSNWNSFSTRMSLNYKKMLFSGIFIIGMLSISYLAFNTDDQKLENQSEFVQGGFADTIILNEKVNEQEEVKLVFDDTVLNNDEKEFKAIASNKKSVKDSSKTKNNSDSKKSSNVIEGNLKSKLSASHFEVVLNKSNFCIGDTIKATYQIVDDHSEDSILSVQWLFNNEIISSRNLKVIASNLFGEVEGSLIVETSSSMIKKDFTIKVFDKTESNIVFEDLEGVKKSVEINVEGLTNINCKVNQHELNEINNTFVYEYSKPGNHYFKITGFDDNGCFVSLATNKKIQNTFNIYAPTAFTPNDDALNNEFMPLGVSELGLSFELYIYDENGNKIFTSQDANHSWNGLNHKGIVEQGVYVWKLIIDNNGVQEFYNGKLVLIK